MRAFKSIVQSWFCAGVIVSIFLVGLFYISEQSLLESSHASVNLLSVIRTAVLLAAPSTLLNWLYEKQGYAQTQRHWIKSPKGLLGKAGYVLTGSIALWGLLLVGIVLAALIIAGLLSLGQAAWSS